SPKRAKSARMPTGVAAGPPHRHSFFLAVNLLFAKNMVSRRRKWVLAVLIVAIAAAGLFIIASLASKRYQPYIREAAIRYLRERFESEVELGDLQIHMPKTSTLRMLITR